MRRYIRFKHSRYIERSDKKQQRLLFSIFLLAAIIIISIVAFFFQLNYKLNDRLNLAPSSPEWSIENDSSHGEANHNQSPDTSASSNMSNPPQTPDNIQSETPTRPSNAEGPFSVTYIADGDTIHINYYGVETSLRLIGVNTPETVDRRTTVQCFGVEASNYLKARLTGQQVYIVSDPTQSDRDGYNRLLRYVYLENEDIGLSIVANGYGHEYTYYVPYQKQSEYQAAERNAETHNLGLWSPDTCGGVTQ